MHSVYLHFYYPFVWRLQKWEHLIFMVQEVRPSTPTTLEVVLTAWSVNSDNDEDERFGELEKKMKIGLQKYVGPVLVKEWYR